MLLFRTVVCQFILLCVASVANAQALPREWRFQGSTYSLTESAGNIRIVYSSPAPVQAALGVTQGALFFTGTRSGSAMSGSVHLYFGARCGVRTYPASVSIDRGGAQLTFSGTAPTMMTDRTCDVVASGHKVQMLESVAPVAVDLGATRPNVMYSTADPTPSPQSLPPDQVQFAAFDFDCQVSGAKVTAAPSSERLYYQIRDYAPTRAYTTCFELERSGWGSMFTLDCLASNLSSHSVACRGGLVSAPRLSIAAQPLDGSGKSLRLSVANDPQGRERLLIHSAKNGVPVAHALPPGWGLLPRVAALTTLPRSLVDGEPRIPTIGLLPAAPPQAHPIPGIISPFATLFPWPQYIIGVALLAFVALVLLSHSNMPSSSPLFTVAGPILLLVVAWYMLPQTRHAADISSQTSFIEEQMSRARAVAGQIRQDEARLGSLLQVGQGYAQPLSTAQITEVKKLAAPRVIPAITMPTEPGTAAFGALLPTLALLALFAHRAFAGFYHAFVRPPVDGVVRHALRRGKPVDMKAAAAALKPDIDQARHPPPAYQARSDAMRLDDLATVVERAPPPPPPSSERGAAMRSKLSAGTRLMNAIFRRHVETEEQRAKARREAEDAAKDADYRERREAALRELEQAKRAYEDAVKKQRDL